MAFDLDDQPTQILLRFIRETETGRTSAEAYNTMYAHKPISPKFTQLTVDQAIAQGKGWTRAHGSSAAGAYQFMNATLIDLKRELGLTGKEVLGPQFQDHLGLTLLNRRGFQKFMTGKISAAEFAKRLAMEWASFPVIEDTKGAHRQVSRGQSYYAGDGLNKALVSPARIEVLLAEVKSSVGGKTKPAPRPSPVEPPMTDDDQPTVPVGGVVATLVVIVLAVIAFLILR